MKRLILGLVAIMAFSMGSINSFAQPFTTQHDTVFATYTGSGIMDLHNDISVATGSVYVKWSVTSTDFSSIPSWSADSNVSVCDNYNCYTNFMGYLLGGTEYMSNPYSGANGLFKLSVNLPNAVNGTHYVTINLKDSMSSYNKNITYVVTKYPTSVKSTVTRSNNQEISLYPNPATDDLNVLFSEDDNIKNIAVYNVIGKAMLVYKVNGRSAKMDISKLPNGVYFIRLSDAKGQVVGTKRFTKQ